ncbi:hypothetical protein [Streptomyces sp. NPDC005281]|uniref:hypothetical protein n=1 Tax=Streptomyces sp. NPDC005281 TaxID=3155712 RepID=UPI0033A91831
MQGRGAESGLGGEGRDVDALDFEGRRGLLHRDRAEAEALVGGADRVEVGGLPAARGAGDEPSAVQAGREAVEELAGLALGAVRGAGLVGSSRELGGGGLDGLDLRQLVGGVDTGRVRGGLRLDGLQLLRLDEGGGG